MLRKKKPNEWEDYLRETLQRIEQSRYEPLPEGQAVVDRLAERAGLTPPRVLLNHTLPDPNARATHRFGVPTIEITPGLWHSARPAVREGVLAHETAHHVLGHTRLTQAAMMLLAPEALHGWEFSADEWAAEQGYGHGLVVFLQTLIPLQAHAKASITHPSVIDRVQRLHRKVGA